MSVISSIRHYFERNGYEVCSRFAEKLGMRVATVRLFFVYLSFFTLGLGFGLYLTLAFVLKLKDLVYAKRSSVFDL